MKHLRDKLCEYINAKVNVVLRETRDGIGSYNETLTEVGMDYIVLDQESGRRVSPADPYIHYEIVIPFGNISRLNKTQPLEERTVNRHVIRV